jgi:sporulation protein YlmC with PRC-barrel domain
MMKSTFTASALALALAAAPAVAQTSPSPSTPPAQTMPAQPGAGASSAMPAPQGGARFFTAMDADQWRASKFSGVDIYGVDNVKIGDVDDVILDRQGNAEAVVIGVGGFLGIGEKQVALPFDQIEWMVGERMPSTAMAPAIRTDGTSATAARPTTAAPGTAAGSGTFSAPAGTANTDVTASTVRAGTRVDYPSYGLLRLTKQDFENAPTYRYGEQLGSSGAGTGTAPATKQ